jgi:large subunit ribosomal protein L17
MRHGKVSSRLGVKADHRVAMLRNLTLGIIQHGRIRTTLARAKKLRPFLEPLVTRLKNPSVANIRIANERLANKEAVLALAQKVSVVFKDRPGGYLRILKLATPRAGDAADMALIEWSDESLVPFYSEGAKKKAPSAKRKTVSKKAARKVKAKKADSAEKKPAKAKKAKDSK